MYSVSDCGGMEKEKYHCWFKKVFLPTSHPPETGAVILSWWHFWPNYESKNFACRYTIDFATLLYGLAFVVLPLASIRRNKSVYLELPRLTLVAPAGAEIFSEYSWQSNGIHTSTTGFTVTFNHCTVLLRHGNNRDLPLWSIFSSTPVLSR